MCVCVQTILRLVSVSERLCSLRLAKPGRMSVSSQNALQMGVTALCSATRLQVTAGVSEWTLGGHDQAPQHGNNSVCWLFSSLVCWKLDYLSF